MESIEGAPFPVSHFLFPVSGFRLPVSRFLFSVLGFRFFGFALLVALPALFAWPTGARATACIGDCNGDGRVLVDELMLGVRIALEHESASSCPAFDADSSGAVTVDELVAGAKSMVGGCAPQLREAFVIATDFQTGSFATIDLDPPRAVDPVSRDRRVHRDAVARAFGGLVYVVNRFLGDTIQILDPSRGFATLATCSVGRGANPHDIAFISSDKAYVTRYELTELLVINPSVGPDCSGFLRGTIDLGGLADADGVPEMDQMLVAANRVYVSLQRLDRNNFFAPAGRGMLAVIDPGRDEIASVITLSGANPFTLRPARRGGRPSLYVSETGGFTALDGGIEYVDLATGEPQGFFITEQDLGGDITGALLVSDRLGYAILSDAQFASSLVAFDPATRAVTGTLIGSSNFISAIEINDRGELYVADRNVTRPGVRVFDAGDGTELTPAPLDVGLPPFQILFLK
jgi:DNA-binding beta-propeller fold protein YncE